MDSKYINITKSYLDQSLAGLSKENPKFDYKRDWYNLHDKKEINEFLKDTSSIANTFGPDGFIVIGFDDKAKTYNDSKFSDSGLKDPNEINGLINKRIDRLFEITTEDITVNNHSLSIIHIPPSIDKPHVIKNYQHFDKGGRIIKEEEHKIFVRKNTSVFPATKYDLELMYYDRKNIIPEYRIQISCYDKSSKFIKDSRELRFEGFITIENTGTRPISITELFFKYPLTTGIDPPYEYLRFSTDEEFKINNLIIRNGEIINKRIKFFNKTRNNINNEDVAEMNSRKTEYFKSATLNLNFYNNKEYQAKFEFY